MCLFEKPARRHYSGPDAQAAAQGAPVVPGNMAVTEAFPRLARLHLTERPLGVGFWLKPAFDQSDQCVQAQSQVQAAL